jgi:hypothetical protein
MAAAVLSTVWFAGEHHLVEAEDRPEDLVGLGKSSLQVKPHSGTR